MENKKIKIMIISIILLIALIPISFYSGMKFANKENSNTSNTNTQNSTTNNEIQNNEEDPTIIDNLKLKANSLIELYFGPISLFFDGEYGDEEKLAITYFIYGQAQFQDKSKISCDKLYQNSNYAIKDEGFASSYAIQINDITSYCDETAIATKYNTLNEVAKNHFGNEYNLIKKGISIGFGRYDYIESIDSYIELNCHCGGAYPEAYYNILETKQIGNEFYITIENNDANNQKDQYQFIFEDIGNDTFIFKNFIAI